MSGVGTPLEFAQKIADVLIFKLQTVEEVFDIEENKDGYFTATLRPKQWLSDLQFRGMCGLVRDLGGDYVKGFKMFRVPGPMAKKSPKQPSEVTPNDVKDDKSKPEVLKVENMGYSLVLPLSALTHMPFRSRTNVEGPEFEELLESVRQHGILEPLVVRRMKSGQYEIVAGERRGRAAERVGLKDVPVIIKSLSDQEACEVQLIENIQRKDLSDMEKARILDYIVKNFNCTQDQLAKKLGKGQSWISQHLAMLQIPESITRVIKHGELTEHQAREIIAAPEEKKQEIIDHINKTGEVPSVREIHDLIYPEIVKPQDITYGKAKELLDTPAGREVLIDAVKDAVAKGEIPVSLDKEESLYADKIETAEDEHEPIEASQKTGVGSSEPVHRHKVEGTQVGEFHCTECNQHFFIDHISSSDHRIHLVREATE